MKYKTLPLLALLILSTPTFANNLSDMEENPLGSRLATVRVCIDLAIYKQSWQVKGILEDYDNKATDYLTSLQDKKRLDKVLKAMTKFQLDMMDSTGNFNWNTTCRSIIEGYKDNNYL